MIDPNKKQSRANLYIAAHYDRLSLVVAKGKKQEWSKIAKEQGMSLTALIIKATEEKIAEIESKKKGTDE